MRAFFYYLSAALLFLHLNYLLPQNEVLSQNKRVR